MQDHGLPDMTKTMVDQTSYRQPNGIPFYAFFPSFHEKSKLLSNPGPNQDFLAKHRPYPVQFAQKSLDPDQCQIWTYWRHW